MEPPAPAPTGKPKPPTSLTFAHTATRAFEVAYWKTIAHLATGQFVNKNNADCVRDPITQASLAHHHRDLDALGDYLLAYYRKLIAKHGMTGKALAGDLPFHWRTDFDFSWMGGWLNNQAGETDERNLIAVIPGRDRSRAVIMADHYDTAYMDDRYEPQYGGNGAAPGRRRRRRQPLGDGRPDARRADLPGAEQGRASSAATSGWST